MTKHRGFRAPRPEFRQPFCADRQTIEQAARWLANLDRALAQADIAGAVALFGDECYWRDLVAFTWNIVTLESRDAISTMLAATLGAIQPSGWALTEPATEKDGVVEGWFGFETAVGRGRGIFRLKEGRCWTLLTTLQELKGFEEKAGLRRIMGAEYGVVKNRQNWLEARRDEEARLGYSEQPYCVIIGGGQGGIALSALEAAWRPHIDYRPARTPRRCVAQTLKLPLFARPGLV